MDIIINRIDDNDVNIKTYFPENKKFTEEEKEDTYEDKGAGLFSIPPKNERFG
jgi:hypothetical protein